MVTIGKTTCNRQQSLTPTVAGEGFLSQKRPALCKATCGNNSIVRIKLSNTIQFLYNTMSLQVKGPGNMN